MTAISTRDIKEKYKAIFNREITDYDIQRLVNFRILKKVRFKDSFYYLEINNRHDSLPTIREVLNDN